MELDAVPPGLEGRRLLSNDAVDVALCRARVAVEEFVGAVVLEDALAQYGLADAPTDVSHDRDDIITDEPTPPDRMLGPEDGYSAAEIAALEKFAEEG